MNCDGIYFIKKTELPSFSRDCNNNFFSLSDNVDASVKIQQTFNLNKAYIIQKNNNYDTKNFSNKYHNVTINN